MQFEYQNNSRIITLLMLFPLSLVMMPRPDIPGIHFLTYPVLLTIILFAVLMNFRSIEISKRVLYFVALLGIYSLAIAMSAMFNSSDIESISLVEIFKPLLFIFILFFGYIVGRKASYAQIKKALLKSAYIILFFQVIVGLPQVFEISLFSFLYNDIKSNGYSGILRIAGTLSNPNFFAWIVIQMAVIIYLFEEKSSKKYVWLLVAGGLVLLSGSRSSLLLLPVILFVVNLLKTKKNTSFFFVKLPIYFVMLLVSFASFYLFLLKYGMYFPYLNQILLIINSGSLSSVNSFDARTIMWENAFLLMSQQSGWLTTIFGLGPGTISALDNDYYYSYVNYGLFGTIVNLLIYLSVIILFVKVKSREFRVLGLQYVLFALIIGYQADTLSGWNYPLLIMFYSGLAVSLLYKKQEDLQQTISVKKKPKKRIVWANK